MQILYRASQVRLGIKLEQLLLRMDYIQMLGLSGVQLLRENIRVVLLCKTKTKSNQMIL